MGPNIIFDKSFLQCLNTDEAVWLDMFFTTNITPLFFIEMLADLEKEVSKGRTPERVVGNLATKTPDWSAVANTHHQTILWGELTGEGIVDMQFGRPLVSGGTRTLLDGKKGVVIEQSPEEEALGRWQQGEFLQLERQQAKMWRRELSLISPEAQRKIFAGWYGANKPTTLSMVKSAADSVIDGMNGKTALSFGLSLLGVQPEAQAEVIQRWEGEGAPALSVFAPYFRYVFGIELFFYYARSADLISERITNKVDIDYLYYLPFCMVFASNDKLHRATVPLFKRSDQSFVWGFDLKSDLGHLDQHYDALPDAVKAKGLCHFASQPPPDPSFLVTQLWDSHMRADWRKPSTPTRKDSDSACEAEILAKIRRAVDNAKTNPAPADNQSDNVDFIVTKHYPLGKKGKWKRFPPEIDQAKGESSE